MDAGTMPVRQLFFVVEREAARMRMRLVPVRDHGERLPAVNGGLGIVPLEVHGQGDDHRLADVYHVFRRLDLSRAAAGREAALDDVFSALSSALARVGFTLRLERRALYGAPLPRTKWRTDAPGISVRPWDVELTALVAALRSIVKLDCIPAELVDRLRQATAERGFRVEVVAPHDPTAADPAVTLLAGSDTRAVLEACDLEARLLAPGDGAGVREAALRMGELLGYPSCCVERFTRVAEQNDTTLAWALLPGVPHAPASPLTQWLQPGLALISHSPCDLHCAATIALGERIREAVEAKDPGFTARWRALSARLQVVDHRGNRMALAAEGGLDAGVTVTAADVLASGIDDWNAEKHARRLVGQTVRADSGGLVTTDGAWHAAYVADHRGRP